MVICQEITPNFNDDPIHASFADFYGSMINTPFFGGYYTTISPLFVVFCVILFAALGLFKYNSKVLESLTIIGTQSTDSKNKKSNKKKQMTFIEKVLLGEQNILKEYELIKVRNERRRLSVFNRQNYGSILGSFSEDEESSKKQPR